MNGQNEVIRILLIDDDPDDQLFFRHALGKAHTGAICDCASGGEEALDKLKWAKILPDYIFLDLNMPKMDGMQVLKAIKETAGIRHIPVIVCSTSSLSHQIAQAKGLGAREYITKPNSIPEFIKIIRRLLDGSV